jgi:hypothetical protein
MKLAVNGCEEANVKQLVIVIELWSARWGQETELVV